VPLDRDEEIRTIASDAVEIQQLMHAVALQVRSGDAALGAAERRAAAAALETREGAGHLSKAHDAGDSCTVM